VTDFGEVNEHYCHAILYMLLTAFGADVHIGEPLGRRMLVAGGTQEHHRMANGIMRIET